VKTLVLLNSLVFAFSLLGVSLVFLFTPLLVSIVYLIKGKKTVKYYTSHPSISLITVVHNAEDFIVDKIKNYLSLNYPSDDYEIIIFSDGSTDGTEKNVTHFTDKKIRLLSSAKHEGKNASINKAVENCSGEIIIFSDVGGILEPNAVLNLVKHFTDSEVGGVCGEMIIYKNSIELEKAQSVYIKFSNLIKKLESQIGSISSNNGALFAFRRRLFKPIPLAVTDDLFQCMSIVKQNYRFIYEPDARVFIKARAKGSSHEIQRRRRVVARSLRGIYLKKGVLNPFKYGVFSLNLLINKIVRRLLPVSLLLIFSSSLFLSFYNPYIKIILFLQIAFYLLAFSHWTLFQYIPHLRIVTRTASTAYYFCLGNYGTLLGLIDFLRGIKIEKWEPIKEDR